MYNFGTLNAGLRFVDYGHGMRGDGETVSRLEGVETLTVSAMKLSIYYTCLCSGSLDWSDLRGRTPV